MRHSRFERGHNDRPVAHPRAQRRCTLRRHNSNGAATVAPGTFHHCGLTGTAKTAHAQALDGLKNRATVPTPAGIHPGITAAWITLPTSDDRGRFMNTDAATIRVFVTRVKDGAKETVNCAQSKAPFIDVHIEANADGPTYHGQPMIVEVTPRWMAAMKRA